MHSPHQNLHDLPISVPSHNPSNTKDATRRHTLPYRPFPPLRSPQTPRPLRSSNQTVGSCIAGYKSCCLLGRPRIRSRENGKPHGCGLLGRIWWDEMHSMHMGRLPRVWVGIWMGIWIWEVEWGMVEGTLHVPWWLDIWMNWEGV